MKAVFFDADDTLINHKECEKQALQFLFDNIGVRFENHYQDIFRPLDRELWSNESYHNVPVSRDEIPTLRFQIFFEEIGIDYSCYTTANNLFKKGLANSATLMKHADEIVKYLYHKGYLLCVVTNGLIELQRPRVANSKIGRYISHIMVSEEVNANKPSPVIFDALLQRIGLSPDDVIMVGDSLNNDVQGAKNANIKAVWLNPEQNRNQTEIVPDFEIYNLLQLKDIL